MHDQHYETGASQRAFLPLNHSTGHPSLLDIRSKPSPSKTKRDLSGCVPSAIFDREHKQEGLDSTGSYHLQMLLKIPLGK